MSEKPPFSDQKGKYQSNLALTRSENPFENSCHYNLEHNSGVNGRSLGNLIRRGRWPVYAPLSSVGVGLASLRWPVPFFPTKHLLVFICEPRAKRPA